jgi:hypothetical protein
MTERRGFAALATVLVPALAAAQEQPMRYGVELRTVGQSYRWRDSAGNLVSGARIAQHLGLTVANIGGRATFTAVLRLDADAGLRGAEATRFDGTLPVSLSLMYGWLEWPGVVAGLDAQVGRLFLVDAADFLALDGARFTYHTPLAGLALQAYAGLEAKGFSPPGAALYELDGVRGARDVTLGTVVPDPLAPVVGLGVSYDRFPMGEIRAGWRRVFRTPDTAAESLVPAEMRKGVYLDAEQVTAAGSLRLVDARLRAYGSAALDLGAGFFSHALLGATFRVSDELVVLAELLRQEPTFALSSIWSYFSHQALDELSLGTGAQLGAAYLEGRLFARALRSPKGIERAAAADPALTAGQAALYDALGVRQALGGRVTLRTAGPRWSADAGIAGHALVAMGPASVLGGGGRRITVDGGGRWEALETISLEGRATFVAYDDEVRPGPDAAATEKGVAMGLSAGATWAIAGDTTLSLVVEDNLTTFAPRAPPRVFAFFDLGRWL